MPPTDIQNNFGNELLKVLAGSPLMLIAVALACCSGHLWSYIILSYFSKKERKILESFYGRISLGLIWFSLIYIPIHFIHVRKLLFDLNSIIQMLPNVIIVSLALQALLFIVINFLSRKGGRNDKKADRN